MQLLKGYWSLHCHGCSRLKENFSLQLKLFPKQYSVNWRKYSSLQKESFWCKNHCINWHVSTCSIIFHVQKFSDKFLWRRKEASCTVKSKKKKARWEREKKKKNKRSHCWTSSCCYFIPTRKGSLLEPPFSYLPDLLAIWKRVTRKM